MRISVIGTATSASSRAPVSRKSATTCLCVDVDKSKVDRINRGEPPIHENGLEELLKRHVGTRLRATTDLRAAVIDSEITFIAVGTPFDGSRIDLSFGARSRAPDRPGDPRQGQLPRGRGEEHRRSRHHRRSRADRTREGPRACAQASTSASA